MKIGHRELDAETVALLAERYACWPRAEWQGRKNERRRWVRRFGVVAQVANDCVLEERAAPALAALCEVMPLDVALRLVAPSVRTFELRHRGHDDEVDANMPLMRWMTGAPAGRVATLAYDPSQVRMTFNGAEVQGFAEFAEAVRAEDTYEPYTRVAARGQGSVTLTLLQEGRPAPVQRTPYFQAMLADVTREDTENTIAMYHAIADVGARVVAQVHDEVVVEAPTSVAEHVAGVMRAAVSPELNLERAIAAEDAARLHDDDVEHVRAAQLPYTDRERTISTEDLPLDAGMHYEAETTTLTNATPRPPPPATIEDAVANMQRVIADLDRGFPEVAAYRQWVRDMHAEPLVPRGSWEQWEQFAGRMERSTRPLARVIEVPGNDWRYKTLRGVGEDDAALRSRILAEIRRSWLPDFKRYARVGLSAKREKSERYIASRTRGHGGQVIIDDPYRTIVYRPGSIAYTDGI